MWFCFRLYHSLLSLCLDRASEWTPLSTVNWFQWSLPTRGRWKLLSKSCWGLAPPVPRRPTRRTPFLKPWKTLSGSCRWQNSQTTLYFTFRVSQSQIFYCVRTAQQSTLPAHPVYQIHIMDKSTLKPVSQGKQIHNDGIAAELLSCWLSDWPSSAFVLTLNMLYTVEKHYLWETLHRQQSSNKRDTVRSKRINLCVLCVYVHMHMFWSPTDSQDPAAGTVSRGASGQRLICSPQPGGRLGHYYTSENMHKHGWELTHK